MDKNDDNNIKDFIRSRLDNLDKINEKYLAKGLYFSTIFITFIM